MSDDLLPLNSTPFERALAGSFSRLSDVQVPLRDLWRPDTCPPDLLPWLAWALSVDEWDGTWSIDRQRAQVAASLQLHMKKGTAWSVKAALSGIGWTVARLEEGLPALRYDAATHFDGENAYCACGRWAMFRLAFDLTEMGLTPAQEAQLRCVVNATRPARSSLERIVGEVSTGDTSTFVPQDGGVRMLVTTWHLYDGTLSFDGAGAYEGAESEVSIP